MGHGEELTVDAATGEPSAERRRAAALAWTALFLLALGLRVACVLAYTEHHPLAERPVIDEASYERRGLAIAGGDWIGDEVFFQEPLYPYFIGAVYAALGPSRLALRLVQALLGALACLGAGLLAARLLGRFAGLFTAGALAVHAPLVLLPCLLLKPSLFLPLWVALAWTLAVATRAAGAGRRIGRTRLERAHLAWWSCGALAGLGALLRGNVLVCLPALVLWPLVRRGAGSLRTRLGHAGLVALGVACVLGPVALRNRIVGGVLVVTTSGAGTNLYGGNAPENPWGVATELPWVRGIPEHEAEDWRREAERRSGRELDPAETSRFWMRALARSVAAEPGLHARILWRKLRLTLGVVEVPDNHDLRWDARFLPLLAWLPGWGAAGPVALAGALLCLAGAARRGRGTYLAGVRDRRGTAELGCLAALYLATIVLTVTSMRARLPLVVLLAPFAGHAAAWLTRARRRIRAAQETAVASGAEVAGALVALLVGVLVVWTPVLPAGQAARDEAERDHNLAVLLLREPDGLPDAARLAAELAGRFPRTARFQVLLAETEVRRALELPRSEAAPLVQAALDRLRPVATSETTSPRERFRARKLAGQIQLWLGNAAAAERHLRAARDFDPDDPELRALQERAAAARRE